MDDRPDPGRRTTGAGRPTARRPPDAGTPDAASGARPGHAPPWPRKAVEDGRGAGAPGRHGAERAPPTGHGATRRH